MLHISRDYRLFLKFIESYSANGFRNINRSDSLIHKIENKMELNRQFIYVADLINLKIEFTSNSCYLLTGIPAMEMDPRTIFAITHPDDMRHHAVLRSRLFKLANEIYINENGFALMSSNLHFQNPQGTYTNFLIQGYLWFCRIPYKTVCCLFVNTDISWFGKIKHGYNSYLGTNLSYFRYPDEKLIMTGNIFTGREFEIIKLIEKGLSSQQIAENLFLSVHTINTHRRRILKKTNCLSLAELIHDLKERGML